MYNSLKPRILIWFGSIILLILVLFSFSFYYFLNKNINENIKIKLNHKALYVKENILPYIKDKSIINDKALSSSYIAIFKNSKIIAKSVNFNLEDINKHIDIQHPFLIIENDNDETINAQYILDTDDYKIYIYDKNIDNKIEEIKDALLIFNPILLLLLILTSSRLIDKVLLPIKKLTKTAKEISVNNFSRTIPRPKDDDEIKELIDSFNEMINRIKDGVETLNRFNNDVSHELRSPLTVIQGEIDVTTRKMREPIEYQKSMKVIHYEAQQMQKIVENLLLLSKYSKNNIKDSFELCSLDSILLTINDKFNARLKEKNINLQLQTIESISINANYTLINSIFSNLIDNAIKYTKENKNIYISLYKKDKIYFIIQDEGIGIAESSLSKITDRFYRVDESRNKVVKGFGLGLSIVKNSIELHNGTIKIKSTPNKGTTVTIVI